MQHGQFFRKCDRMDMKAPDVASFVARLDREVERACESIRAAADEAIKDAKTMAEARASLPVRSVDLFAAASIVLAKDFVCGNHDALRDVVLRTRFGTQLSVCAPAYDEMPLPTHARVLVFVLPLDPVVVVEKS